METTMFEDEIENSRDITFNNADQNPSKRKPSRRPNSSKKKTKKTHARTVKKSTSFSYKIKINKKGFPVEGGSFKQMNKQKKVDKKFEDSLEDNSDSGSYDDETLVESQAETNMTTLSMLMGQAALRNKKETLEEKKARKKLFKEIKRARREERKNTRAAFQEENVKQAKADINRQRDKCIRL